MIAQISMKKFANIEFRDHEKEFDFYCTQLCICSSLLVTYVDRHIDRNKTQGFNS